MKEKIQKIVEEMVESGELVLFETFTDDHIEGCIIKRKDDDYFSLWWCGPEIVGAVQYLDSPTARKDLIEYIMDCMEESLSFWKESDWKTDDETLEEVVEYMGCIQPPKGKDWRHIVDVFGLKKIGEV